MQLENVGRIDISEERVASIFPGIRDGRYSAVNDISLANSFYVHSEPRDHDANIGSLSVLAASHGATG